MKLTKKQFTELQNRHIGGGWLVFRSDKNTVTTIDIYIKDGILRNANTGKPIDKLDTNENE